MSRLLTQEESPALPETASVWGQGFPSPAVQITPVTFDLSPMSPTQCAVMSTERASKREREREGEVMTSCSLVRSGLKCTFSKFIMTRNECLMQDVIR